MYNVYNLVSKFMYSYIVLYPREDTWTHFVSEGRASDHDCN